MRSGQGEGFLSPTLCSKRVLPSYYNKGKNMATKKVTAKETKEKQKVIGQINRLFELNGPFTAADVMATSSPIIRSGKNSCTLAERFYRNSCEGVDYVHETETGSDDYEYEDLDLDVLHEILFLAEDWDTIWHKTQKRCSN